MLAGVLVVSSAGVAFAAAPSVDTETTDTVTTSDINDQDTITYNSTDAQRNLSFSADSANGSVKVLQDGTELAAYPNGSSSVTVQDAVVSGTYYFNSTFQDDFSDYGYIEVGEGETADITLQMVNDSNNADPDLTNVTVTLDNTGSNVAFARVNDSEVTVGEVSTTASILASVQQTVPLLDAEEPVDPIETTETDIAVNGSDHNRIKIGSVDAEADNALNSSVPEEGVGYAAAVTVGDELVPVVSSGSDAPDWIETASETYAVIEGDSNDKVVIYNAGDSLSDDQSSVDVTVDTIDDVGVTEAFSLARDYGGSVTDAAFAAAGAV